MPPSSPACLQLLRPGGDPLIRREDLVRRPAPGPASAAFPESSAHRSTRANFAATSRRFFAFFGATSITARAIAARSAPGVSRPARSSTSCSAARASAGSRPRSPGR